MSSQDSVVGRTLGALEEILWVYDQWTPFHFVVAVEIKGETQPSDWQFALDALQRRHPLLSARIHNDGSSTKFSVRPQNPIPLRVLPNDGRVNWHQLAAAELHTPFVPTEAPLLRATVVHARHESVLILAAHHSIADGMSVVYAIRDLLEALPGVPLHSLTLQNSQERLLGLPERVPEDGTAAAREVSVLPEEFLQKPRQPNHHPPVLEARRLSSELTQRLSQLARDNATTVHGILCAALILAGRELSSDWAVKTVRLLSPVNLRSITGVKDDVVVNFANAITTTAPDSPTGLIELAQRIKRELSEKTSPQSLGELGVRMVQLSNAGLDLSSTARFMFDRFESDALVTNLGVLPIPTKIGAFTIEGFWGPAVMTGVPGEQTIGVATIGGSMCLLHSSYSPLPSLLDRIASILSAAV